MTVLRPGARLGDWVVERTLGEGGMGAVYRCHSVLAADVCAAVKVLKQSDLGSAAERFVQELRTLSQLSHPAIVRVLGGGKDEARGVLYMAMELIEGEDLTDRLARGALTPEQAVAVFAPVADALAYAHQRGVAHRDIKPSNIMLRADGTPVIVDFGIAVAEGSTRHTREGMVPGTIVYLPPEVFEGAPPDPKSTDAYALGVVIYEALTALSPFAVDPSSGEGEQLVRVMGMKLRGDALDPGKATPGHLREAVLRTTDPEPKSRLVDLGAVRDLLTTGQANVALPRLRRKRRRGWGLAIAASALLLGGGALAIAVVAGVAAWVYTRPPAEPSIPPVVDVAATVEAATAALERGDVAAARRDAGLALDAAPAEPQVNLLYGLTLLADGQGALARPYLCAAVDAGFGARTPGHATGELDCARGPGAASPITAPLALAEVDLGGLASLLGAEPAGDDAPAVAAPSAPRPAPRASPSPAPAPRDLPKTAPPARPGGKPPMTGAPSEPAAASPTVAVGAVSEGLDRGALEVRFRGLASTFARCGASPGRVELEVVIGPGGAVADVVVRSDTTGNAGCMVLVVRRTTFGRDAGTVTVVITVPP